MSLFVLIVSVRIAYTFGGNKIIIIISIIIIKERVSPSSLKQLSGCVDQSNIETKTSGLTWVIKKTDEKIMEKDAHKSIINQIFKK